MKKRKRFIGKCSECGLITHPTSRKVRKNGNKLYFDCPVCGAEVTPRDTSKGVVSNEQKTA